MVDPPQKATAKPVKLVLSGNCCIDGLGAHHEQLLQALEDGAAVELDLKEVSRMDTAGLQLLLVFVTAMKRQGSDVSILDASEAVKQCATSAGVAEQLRL